MQSETAFPVSVKGAAIAGFEELLGGIHHWRVWHLLGVNDLRHRYARSKLGQLWLTLSTAIMIGVLAAVYSLLFNQPMHELMPFIGVSLIMWNYLSQVLIRVHVNLRHSGQLISKPKDELFGIDLFRDLQEHNYACAQPGHHRRSHRRPQRPGQLVSSADRASIRTYVDWNGLVGIPHRHDMRALS